MNFKSVRKIFFTFAVVAMLAAPATAQNRDVAGFERTLEQIRRQQITDATESIPAEQRTLFDYGAYISLSYLSLDDSQSDNHGLRQADFYAYARAQFDNGNEFFLLGQADYSDYNPGDSFEFDGTGDGWDLEIARGYWRFNLRQYMASRGQETQNDLTIQVGRDLTTWGNGLTLSQVLDGALIGVKVADVVDLNFVAGLTSRNTVDIDTSRPDFDQTTKRGFFGVIASTTVGQHQPYIYALSQNDYNPRTVFDLGPITTNFEYNSWYLGIGSSGSITDRLSYGIEATYEGGTTLSNSFLISGPFLTPVAQQEDNISAGAMDARLDYFVGDDKNSSYGAEMIVASGDRDRLNTTNTFGGNAPGTQDHAFNAFGLLNTGQAFSPNVSNLFLIRLGASTFPMPDVPAFRRLQIGTDFFLYSKLTSRAPIDEPTNEGSFLGFEPDIFINWQITSDITFGIRYGIFIPQSNMFVDDSVRQFLYTSMTFSF